MTNTLYFRHIVRSDSSSVVDENEEEETQCFDAENGSEAVEKEEELEEEEEEDVPLGCRLDGELVDAGWPTWLIVFGGEAIKGWTPRQPDSFQKLDQIGQGKDSIGYKARDRLTGKIVSLKKVRFSIEPESVKSIAREILIMRRLDHPNVIKLEGLVASRMSCSLYFIFEYIEYDLASITTSSGIMFTVPQVKCYMHQLLSGLEHCHNQGVLHRDINRSNLLLDNNGILKIVNFGSASFFDPNHKQTMTSGVVTLWYRALELLLGATNYGIGVDLWSTGCILAELLTGKPIMPGRTEVEQVHKIFKLCGFPSEDYWKKLESPQMAIFKPSQLYRGRLKEKFKNFPPSSLPLLETLLAFDPVERQTATAALQNEFFADEPHACEPSSLRPQTPSKELSRKSEDNSTRLRVPSDKASGNGTSIIQPYDQPVKENTFSVDADICLERFLRHVNGDRSSDNFLRPHKNRSVALTSGSTSHSTTSGSADASASTSPEKTRVWSAPDTFSSRNGQLDTNFKLYGHTDRSVASASDYTSHSTSSSRSTRSPLPRKMAYKSAQDIPCIYFTDLKR